MARKSKRDGKIYKQPTSGAGLEPGTVDWELKRRQVQAQNRREDRAFRKMMAERAAQEPKGFWKVWDAVVRFLTIPRERSRTR
jgi:hypothetical protein